MKVLLKPVEGKCGLAHDDDTLYVLSPCCSDLVVPDSHHASYSCKFCFKPIECDGSGWKTMIKLVTVTSLGFVLASWAESWTGIADIAIEVEWDE